MKFIVKPKRILLTVLFTAIGINFIGYLGAYQLTHYRQPGQKKLGFSRPEHYQLPSDRSLNYTTERIKINNSQWLETWLINPATVTNKGTVILFHGKNNSKSSSIEQAIAFLNLGYRTLLVDFQGVGGSSGSTTTIGVKESQDVITAFNYVRDRYSEPVILYGVSMGSAAILRAIAKHNLNPDAIILELPFARLTSAVKLRLQREKIPAFPLTELFIFWGGIYHGFNGFAHNSIDYAHRVNCPTLILHGEQDMTVKKVGVKELFNNIPSQKKLVGFVDAKHQLLIKVNPQLWKESVTDFLDR